MSLDLTRPGPLASIVGKRQLEATPLPQPRRVGGRRHEARTTEIQIALAWAFRRKPQAMPEFKLGLEEIAAQPVDRFGAQRSGPDCFRAGPGDRRSRLQHGSIITQHFSIADARIDHRHLRALMTEDAHDGVQLRAALGELCAQRMSKPMHCDRRLAPGIDQVRRLANTLQWRFEQVFVAHQLAAPDEHEADQASLGDCRRHGMEAVEPASIRLSRDTVL